MIFKAFILILATLKIFSTKSIEKDQNVILQCNIPDGKQFNKCTFSQEDQICVIADDKTKSENCNEDFWKDFIVEKSNQGCILKIHNLNSFEIIMTLSLLQI